MSAEVTRPPLPAAACSVEGLWTWNFLARISGLIEAPSQSAQDPINLDWTLLSVLNSPGAKRNSPCL